MPSQRLLILGGWDGWRVTLFCASGRTGRGIPLRTKHPLIHAWGYPNHLFIVGGYWDGEEKIALQDPGLPRSTSGGDWKILRCWQLRLVKWGWVVQGPPGAWGQVPVGGGDYWRHHSSTHMEGSSRHIWMRTGGAWSPGSLLITYVTHSLPEKGDSYPQSCRY